MSLKDTWENRKLFKFQLILLWAVVLIFTSFNTSQAEDETIESPIVLGMSTALTGPAAELGINMRLGIDVRFERENSKGGVKGRKLHLLAWDDGYEPARTTPNVRDLIEEEEVLAIIGNVGTPTAISVIPIVNAERTLFFAPYTGAGVLRKHPPDRYIINYRASYAEETSAMVNALINKAGIKPEEVAFFTQRDGYGDAGYVGGITALKKQGLKSENLITHSRYERNTLAVENAVADILLADPVPRAIIMVGAYAPSARFIKLARKAGIEALFLNVSFVGSAPLARELGPNIDGVIVTQVVPYPKDKSVFIVEKYHDDMTVFAPNKQVSFGSLEGYIAADIFIKALETVEGIPNRENIIDALENLGEFQIGTGEKLFYDKNNHQASHRVWSTLLREGTFVPFSWINIPLIIQPR